MREYHGESRWEWEGKLGPDDPEPIERDEDAEYEYKRAEEEEDAAL